MQYAGVDGLGRLRCTPAPRESTSVRLGRNVHRKGRGLA